MVTVMMVTFGVNMQSINKRLMDAADFNFLVFREARILMIFDRFQSSVNFEKFSVGWAFTVFPSAVQSAFKLELQRSNLKSMSSQYEQFWTVYKRLIWSPFDHLPWMASRKNNDCR